MCIYTYIHAYIIHNTYTHLYIFKYIPATKKIDCNERGTMHNQIDTYLYTTHICIIHIYIYICIYIYIYIFTYLYIHIRINKYT